MIKWIHVINWKKVFTIAFFYTIVTMIVRQVEAFLTMKYYLLPQYFGVWSKLMMPNAGPPPVEFFITSLVFTFASGISLAVIYYYLKEYLPKGFWKRVFFFADVLVATSFIFFTLPVYMMFNVPVGLLLSWFISGFILNLFASFIIVKGIGA